MTRRYMHHRVFDQSISIYAFKEIQSGIRERNTFFSEGLFFLDIVFKDITG
jgi:hypothetical protein